MTFPAVIKRYLHEQTVKSKETEITEVNTANQ